MKQKLKLFLYFLKKDIKAKYAGSGLGLVWTVLLPLVQIFLFWLVFSAILRSRPYTTVAIPYIYFLLSSFFFWLSFSDSLMRSSVSILENSETVKKISFPIAILPATATVATYLQHMVGFLIFLAVYCFTTPPSPVFVFVLPVFFLQMLFSLGLGLIFSALLPYIRDIGQILGQVMQGAFFLCPVIYSMDAIPEKYRILFYANPMTYFISTYHRILLMKELPTIESSAVMVAVSFTTFAAGYYLFKVLKDGFADVL